MLHERLKKLHYFVDCYSYFIGALIQKSAVANVVYQLLNRFSCNIFG
jgi:hypothetical protein